MRMEPSSMRVLGETDEECTDTCRDQGQLQAVAPGAPAASRSRREAVLVAPRRMAPSVSCMQLDRMRHGNGQLSACMYYRMCECVCLVGRRVCGCVCVCVGDFARVDKERERERAARELRRVC
jgi:hypothetical protein